MEFTPLTDRAKMESCMNFRLLVDFIEKLGEETNKNWTNHWGQGTPISIAQKIWVSEDHKIYFALENDEIVAVGHLHYFVGDECYLGMAVRDDKQRRGFGSLMVEYLMKQVSDLNIKTVFLDVYTDNIPALRFYEKHGFQYCHEITLSGDPRKRYTMLRFVEPKK